jgi:hypothetical protein
VKLAIAAVLPIALLLGLLLFFQAQERANRNGAVCEGNLATISLLLQNYARIKHHFPPSTLLDSQGKPLHSWRLLVLETAGAPLDSLFQQADLTVPWNHARNKHLHDLMPGFYRCPNHGSDSADTSYLAIVGPGTTFPIGSTTRPSEITDDMTLQIGETTRKGVCWLAPVDLDVRNMGFTVDCPAGDCLSSHDPSGAGALYVDGTRRRVTANTPPEILRAATTIHGGKRISREDY